ncbi:MAG: VOC family protein [Ignavibacteriaceae bacterium]|nr:VOC family protein [Ignavibacteriaceae bacterium]
MDSETGKITWFDLTVPNADEVKDFYSKVVGWKSEPFAMQGYNDYNMQTPVNGETVAGICHARGENSNLPAQWLIYITVDNIEASATACKNNGGKIVAPIKEMGTYGKSCVIKDPAGAVAALFESMKKT